MLRRRLIQIKPLDSFQKADTPVGESSIGEDKIILQRELEIMRSELGRLKDEKDRMLSHAIEEIKSEKEKWSTEKARLVEEAHDQGYQAGFTQGENQSSEQYSVLLAKANEIMTAATTDYHETLDKSGDVIIKIAVHVAEKIINTQIAEDSNVFLDVIKAAIGEIKDQSIVSIYLHPNDYELVLEHKNELRNSLEGDAKLTIYVDQTMTEHGCVIEHPFGRIDASLDTQLKQIRTALEELVMENES